MLPDAILSSPYPCSTHFTPLLTDLFKMCCLHHTPYASVFFCPAAFDVLTPCRWFNQAEVSLQYIFFSFYFPPNLHIACSYPRISLDASYYPAPRSITVLSTQLISRKERCAHRKQGMKKEITHIRIGIYEDL